MIGLGTQDDFAYATEFVDTLGTQTPTMLWDPSFSTWRALGVTTNSQMMVLSPDLETGTQLFFGFGEDEQQIVLDLAAELRP